MSTEKDSSTNHAIKQYFSFLRKKRIVLYKVFGIRLPGWWVHFFFFFYIIM